MKIRPHHSFARVQWNLNSQMNRGMQRLLRKLQPFSMDAGIVGATAGLSAGASTGVGAADGFGRYDAAQRFTK